MTRSGYMVIECTYTVGIPYGIAVEKLGTQFQLFCCVCLHRKQSPSSLQLPTNLQKTPRQERQFINFKLVKCALVDLYLEIRSIQKAFAVF